MEEKSNLRVWWRGEFLYIHEPHCYLFSVLFDGDGDGDAMMHAEAMFLLVHRYLYPFLPNEFTGIHLKISLLALDSQTNITISFYIYDFFLISFLDEALQVIWQE